VAYLTRDQPEARSVDDAVDRLRRSSTSVDEDDGSDGGTAVRLPRPGVYEAVGRGREEISFPPNAQDDGTVMPVSVELIGGECFRFRVDYNEAHWHEWDLCRPDGGLQLTRQVNYQRWDFGAATVENTSENTCDPPAVWLPAGAATDDIDGEVVTNECQGTNTAVPGISVATDRTEVVGRQVLRIGGERVDTIRITQRTDMTGAQRGRNLVELWFEADTGLPVRFERDYVLETDSPVGAITYTEEGEWQLRSVEPRT
jgi:hypothetical protein